jgi:hypothetical protein
LVARLIVSCQTAIVTRQRSEIGHHSVLPYKREERLIVSLILEARSSAFPFHVRAVPRNAFLWDKGSLVDLNTFVPSGSKLQLTEATYINDRREISVQGVLPNGDTRAVLLAPGGQGETLVSATQASTVTQHNLTRSEIMAAVRARLGKRYHIPTPKPRHGIS